MQEQDTRGLEAWIQILCQEMDTAPRVVIVQDLGTYTEVGRIRRRFVQEYGRDLT